MIRTSFNDGWFFRPKAEAFLTILGQADTGWEPVRLPHDAMVHGERDGTDTTADITTPGVTESFRRRRSIMMHRGERT
ncbi:MULTISPECIES: hypothetical protein [Pseudofrankia]|uniref:hypothetical protein n=1 Tax=Pseudofrankia TaxID=2994363 RepID=UPI000234C797|nr:MULTISPECIES: hypothetical protein [Pseudofrankia]OHV29154.1 hypothetical protein BCD49_36350 [Pseudofrankia sp. EUN1h]